MKFELTVISIHLQVLVLNIFVKMASNWKPGIDRLFISFVICLTVIRVFIELNLVFAISAFLVSVLDEVTVLLELVSPDQVDDHVCRRSGLIRMEGSIGHAHLVLELCFESGFKVGSGNLVRWIVHLLFIVAELIDQPNSRLRVLLLTEVLHR